ncbi:hypothetical protein GLOTRDRAFT_133862 [Gloeophyllum trabeum ATCC 11539]|uniref:F-box domain-containing protein n=1 Tax=Gloeophyllum trabeum (strain ATCC 11539 / FP-39264 / Madison 617) TaxID=670483 RepID=S7RDK3_GLOTA|nr:uncharacterized protein GLOTRDRAFT_133862 [Gloeophyllum trabeum ATCC 11539]EPQ50489.1 hypothetical protein GLOTRDRAFT_133862 [Gloeophyllum trabeum ATCC 11539]
MGQYWMVVNIDKWQQTGDQAKLFEIWLWERSSPTSDSLLNRLLPPMLDPAAENLTKELVKHVKSPIEAGLGRLSLPMELLHMIFANIEDIRDVACLCICNKTLWAIGYKYVLKKMEEDPTRWDGDRLIFVGDCSEGLPEGVLSAEELAKLREELPTLYDSDSEDAVGSESNHPSLYTIACELCHNRQGHRDGSPYDRREWKMPSPEGECYRKLTTPYYVQYDDYALCNLSKLQYVRADIVTEIVGEALHLGDVLLCQIGWSTTSLLHESGLQEGPWAGDRFRVTTMNEVNGPLTKKGVWKDVSSDVMKRVVEIWREVHGPKWPALEQKDE